MGFLDRFFKPKIIEKEVKLEELKEYSEETLKEKLHGTNEKIEEIRLNIEEIKKKINQNLKYLREAELQNKNLPLRAIHLMEGNREAYIKKIENFLERINIPEKELYSSINDFCKDFDLKLNELNKASFKGYEIMKEFFYNQATEIAMGIKEIEQNIKTLKEIVQNKEISKIERLKKLISNIEKYDENKKRLQIEIQEHIYEIKELEQKIESVKTKFEQIKKSNEYSDYKKTSEEKEAIINKIKEEKDKIIQKFSILEKSLKKYKRDSLNEKLIEDYLEDPSEALMKDTKLEIIEILEKLKDSIQNERIDLKDKKKEKTLKIISQLNKKFLDDIRLNIEQLTRTKISLNDKLRKNNINCLYKEEKYKMEHYQQKLNEKSKKLEELKKEEKNLDIEKIKEEIKKEFISILNIRLKIIG